MVPAIQVQKQADGLFYRTGELHPFTGRTAATYTNGVKRGAFAFRAGRPDGPWQEWHSNGKPRRMLNYSAGKLNGEFVEWHSNGRVKQRAHFADDQPHGEWNEWDATGLHAVRRKFQHGLLVSEQIPVELMQRVDLITQLRARFDRLVWQPELDAQRFHETMVAAWDSQRAAKDKFAALEEIQFGTLSIEPGRSFTPAEWKTWLKARRGEGWEIEGTHWRQEQFTFQNKKAESKYAFTVRAQNGQRRIVLRGLLTIHWTETQDAQEHFLPGKMIVSELQRAERNGAPGRSAVGAVVTARAGKKVWRHWVVTGDSWRAQHPFTAHFGLGNVTSVDSLEVRWPDGRVTRLANPLAGKYHILSATEAKLDSPGEGR